MPDPADDRDPFEVLATEFMERQRRGECPSVEEYAQRHPELADEIRDLFPTILATEHMKATTAHLSGDRPSLAAVQLERLGDFRIVREIGRGGMGIVYEAEQESLGRRVAIKVLPRQALLDDKHLRRFLREARIAAGLHHTNIAEVFGVGEQDGFHYFVMQYIDGVGLDRIIQRLARLASGPAADAQAPPDAEAVNAIVRRIHGEGGPPYWRQVAALGRQVAEALHYSHSQGTLHRDIKPGNLLVDAHGRVWVTDFGLAKALRSEDVTVTGEITGTLRYMAPEQLEGHADARSDVYSLGLTLFELLTFRPAFEETDRNSLFRRIAAGHPPPPRSLNPQAPRDIETIVLKATARDPGHRYASAEALAKDLQRFLDDQPIAARRASAFERLSRWCRRNKAVASLAGTTALLILLVAGVATVGYLSTRKALREARASAELATDAIDRIFDRFSPRSVVGSPGLMVDNVEGSSVDVRVEPVLSKEAAALLEDMLPFYERLARQVPDAVALRWKVAEANRRVGDIRQRLGQHDQAVAAYRHAIGLYQGLGQSPSDGASPRVEIAKTYNELGRLYQARDPMQQARDAHQNALAILEAAPNRSAPTPEFQLELARTHYFLAIATRPEAGGEGEAPAEPLARAGSGSAGASPSRFPQPSGPAPLRHLKTAIALLSPLREADPANPQYRHLLGLCYREQYHAIGWRNPEAGRVALDKATEILRQLVRDFSRVPDYQFDLSETYAAVDPLRPGPAPYASHVLEERLRQALGLSSRLVEHHPYVPRYVISRAQIGHQLASLLEQGGRLDEAEPFHTAALGLQRSLASQFPETLYHKVRLGEFSNDLARLLLLRHRPEEAQPVLEAAVDVLTPALKVNRELRLLHALLARSYGALEATFRDLGNEQAAAQAHQKAEEHRKAMLSAGQVH